MILQAFVFLHISMNRVKLKRQIVASCKQGFEYKFVAIKIAQIKELNSESQFQPCLQQNDTVRCLICLPQIVVCTPYVFFKNTCHLRYRIFKYSVGIINPKIKTTLGNFYTHIWYLLKGYKLFYNKHAGLCLRSLE